MGIEKSSCSRCVVLLWQLVPVLTLIFLGGVDAENCSLASYYGSHMVLQQQPHNAIIWGYADIKATIEVKVAEKTYKALAEREPFSKVGIWRVKLDPMKAGGPYTIQVSCTSSSSAVNTILLEDVMFGDVWVCSGQSNMAFNVNASFNGSQELNASVNYPNIRLFAVQMMQSGVPFYDFHGLYEPWSRPSPKTLGVDEPFLTYFSALCWFYGRHLHDSLKYPIGLISSSWGGTTIQAWSSPDALKQCGGKACVVTESKKLSGPVGFEGPHNLTVLWNAMIHPLLNFTIKGVIWYQGEDNTYPDPNPYKCMFNAMITDWRKKWHEGTEGGTDIMFPFGFMQLCTSQTPRPYVVGPYPLLRWHQTYDYGYVPNDVLRNVFMGVTIDLPDPTSIYGPIHPRDKEDMGLRLSLAGRAVAYGQDVTFAGPFPSSFNVNVTTHTVIIQYDSGNANIKLVGKDGFEICCSHTDECYPWSGWMPMVITDQPTTSSLSLHFRCYDYENHPVAIRYLWKDMPCTFKNCPVYSVENELPGAPFLLSLVP